MENHFLKSELETVRARPGAERISRSDAFANGSCENHRNRDRRQFAGRVRGPGFRRPGSSGDGCSDTGRNRRQSAQRLSHGSQVLLITDPTFFGAGVISQKNRVHGTIRGLGQSKCIIDHVQNEEKVDVGEMFYTSGDDRIFPKGMPVGRATVVRPGKTAKEIYVVPSGFQNGLEEVLVVVQGEHQAIPNPTETAASDRHIPDGSSPELPRRRVRRRAYFRPMPIAFARNTRKSETRKAIISARAVRAPGRRISI